MPELIDIRAIEAGSMLLNVQGGVDIIRSRQTSRHDDFPDAARHRNIINNIQCQVDLDG